MERIGKQSVSLMLALLLLISVLPVTGRAATAENGWIIYTGTTLAEENGRIEAIPDATGYYLVYDDVLLEQLKASGVVAASAPDEKIFPAEGLTVGNDPGQYRQWYLDAAGYFAARKAGLDGSDVKVAIIDSGCRLTHEDLQTMHVVEAKSFLWKNESIEDEADHGTAVAGILAAAVDNGAGISGLAPRAEYFILRVFSASFGMESSLISALGYAIDAGVDVINISLGSPGNHQRDILEPLIQKANEQGIIVVSAVGNAGNTQVYYPAGCDGVIGVGSVSRKGEHSSFSNLNESVDVVAPGEEIVALSGTRDNGYRITKGTSFSTPIVTAMAVWAKQTDKSINAEKFLELLRESSTDRGVAGYDTEYGWGMINGEDYVARLNAMTSNGSDSKLPFTDVAVNDWFYSPVVWAYESGMMNGVSATSFQPQGTVTRAMVVSMLYRFAGSPGVTSGPQFSDVTDGTWYAAPVRWAASEGVVQGVGNGLFAPNTPITREQFVMILYRYAKAAGADLMADSKVLQDYQDAGNIDSWAVDAMSWAVSTGLMRGSGGQLTPLSEATRAQAAALLQSFAGVIQGIY